jgi:hypothetical protein
VAIVRAHALAAAIVASALVGSAALLAFARPEHHRAPPGHALPYDVAVYSAVDARRAFATEGVELAVRARTPVGITLGDRRDVLEVDAFADRAKLEAAGFHDFTIAGGRYVRFARRCVPGGVDAERWRGNVRVIVDCSAAGADAGAWTRRVERALARL